MSSRYFAHFISEAGDTEVDAGLATGTGTAHNASILIQPNTGLASGTGAALDATVSTQTSTSANAELASGSGAASGPTPSIAPNAGAAAGTGSASDATVTIGQYASAGAASGSGAAQSAAPAVAPRAGSSSGAGSASNATADVGGAACEGVFQNDAFQSNGFQICGDVSANAGVATGTGQAYNATVTGAAAHAETATGTGSALGPTPSVAPNVGTGTGTGTAHQLMVVGLATGTGSAHDAEIWADDNYGATPEGDIPTGYMPPLPAPVDDDDTVIPNMPQMGSTPDVPFVVIIDGEQWLVTNVAPDGTWTVVRAYNGTTATAHSAGAIARPALVRIRVDGVDIAADVNYQRSRFTTGANGQAGTAEIWVRDLDRTRSFTTGAEVIVGFRGVRQWGGYLAAIRRQYVFSAGTGRIGEEPRWLILDCVDYNVLFNKRIFFRPGDPTLMRVKHWPNGTWDSVVISEVVHNYLTLEDDGLRYDIQHVGTPALPQISCNPDAPDVFGVGSAGWTWGQLMTAIVSQTGAVYYIDPDKTFRYVDDATKQSRFGWNGLSDNPNNTTTIGYRDAEFTSDGTRLTNDHLQWGAGQGSDQMVFSRTQDASSIADHGLWQTGELRYDLWCQESVDLRGETWVYGSPQNRRGGNDDRFFSRVTVREPYFRVADVLSLESEEFDFFHTVPVRYAETDFPTPWDIRSILTLAHEIDAPWSTFEFWIPQFKLELDEPELVVPPPPDPWGPLDPCACVGEGDGCLTTDFNSLYGTWHTSGSPVLSSSYVQLGPSDLIEAAPPLWANATTISASAVFKTTAASGTERFNLYARNNGAFLIYARAFVTVAGTGAWTLTADSSIDAGDTFTGPAWQDDTDYVLDWELDIGGDSRARLYEASGPVPDWQVTATVTPSMSRPYYALITNLDSGGSFDFYVDRTTVCGDGSGDPEGLWLTTTSRERVEVETDPSGVDVGIPVGDAGALAISDGLGHDNPLRTQFLSQVNYPIGTTRLRFPASTYSATFAMPQDLTAPDNSGVPLAWELFDVDDPTVWPPTGHDPAGTQIGAGAAQLSGGGSIEIDIGALEFDAHPDLGVSMFYVKRDPTAPPWGVVSITADDAIEYLVPGSATWDCVTNSDLLGLGVDCLDLELGELLEPPGDGPNVGEGADTTFEVGDNGGIIFHTDEQFQVGSSEVWVDGLRIRIGTDYIEYPRQAMIEILDHIDVGTEGDPATVLVNYIIWTIDDPIPE